MKPTKTLGKTIIAFAIACFAVAGIQDQAETLTVHYSTTEGTSEILLVENDVEVLDLEDKYYL